jgi:hypothetical protein
VNSDVVYLNYILFSIVLYKNKNLVLNPNFLFNFENRQIPVTHHILPYSFR